MIRIQIILIAISFISSVQAQSTIGAKGKALAHATHAMEGYSWSLFSNPSALQASQYSVGFFTIQNYGIKELTEITSFITMPTNRGIIGLGIYKYGDEKFSEVQGRVGYKNEWENLHYGISMTYYHISFGGRYGAGGAIGINMGFLARLNKELSLGVIGNNLNTPKYKFKKGDEDLVQDLSMSIHYKIAAHSSMVFGLVKDVRFPVSYRMGMDVELVRSFYGRIGVSTKPESYSFGFGYMKQWGEINIVIERHTYLGISPGFDLVVHI